MKNEITKIENYWNGDYVLSSPDLIAVKCGLKKTTRIECNSRAACKKIREDFKKHDLVTVASDKKLFGNFNIYISRDKKLAEKAKVADPSYRIIVENYSFNDALPWVREYSDLISYPECCIEEYLKNTLNNTGISEIKAFQSIPKRIDWRINNTLNGLSNYYLSFHFPCSFDCDATLKYQTKIFEGRFHNF